ncbi:MAG TPA: radical SAM protein, partial [Treponemataceae bacterium]|nr:radical SAM protein [Treponemataceae bacterium]
MNSFSLYIHIPFCASKCNYCDFFSISCERVGSFDKKKSCVGQHYLDALIKDTRNHVSTFNINSWKSIYMGGGTPSLLSIDQITTFFRTLYTICSPTPDAEITFEANPDDITSELLACLLEARVNRLSLGVQSFDEKVLSTIGRRANAKQNRQALKCIKNYWLVNNNQNT